MFHSVHWINLLFFSPVENLSFTFFFACSKNCVYICVSCNIYYFRWILFDMIFSLCPSEVVLFRKISEKSIEYNFWKVKLVFFFGENCDWIYNSLLNNNKYVKLFLIWNVKPIEEKKLKLLCVCWPMIFFSSSFFWICEVQTEEHCSAEKGSTNNENLNKIKTSQVYVT